jgi:hypothetical protein
MAQPRGGGRAVTVVTRPHGRQAGQSQAGETDGRDTKESVLAILGGRYALDGRPVASHHHLAALLAGLLGNMQLC